MPINPLHLPILAQQREDDNWRFRQFLKQRCNLDSDELDQRIIELAALENR